MDGVYERRINQGERNPGRKVVDDVVQAEAIACHTGFSLQ
jgi:hypothetical protein